MYHPCMFRTVLLDLSAQLPACTEVVLTAGMDAAAIVSRCIDDNEVMICLWTKLLNTAKNTASRTEGMKYTQDSAEIMAVVYGVWKAGCISSETGTHPMQMLMI